MRPLEAEDLVGKTIVDVDVESLNNIILTFDDETEVSIWCELGVSTDMGDTWGFFVEDE